MGKIIFSLTADWEGEHFRNISDLFAVRKQVGEHIPITHFICPAYFTKGIKNAKAKINRAIFDIDEVALHIHCYESLVTKAGVRFRTEPDFFKGYSPAVKKIISHLPKRLQPKKSGRGVPLSAYSYNEIIKILKTSRELMFQNFDIKELNGFRAGGWIASDDVLRALAETGFKYDSSATPPSVLSQGFSKSSDGNFQDDYGDSYDGFSQYIIRMWGHKLETERFLANSLTQKYCPDDFITTFTQPYRLPNIIEMPNNASMSDYASVEKTMLPVLEKGLSIIKKHNKKDFYLNVGFHQEGDFTYKVPIIKLFRLFSPQPAVFHSTVGKAMKLWNKELKTEDC